MSPSLDEAWLKCAFVSGLPRDVGVQLKASSAVDDLTLFETLERTRIIITTCRSEVSCAARTVRCDGDKSQSVVRQCSYCKGTDHFVKRCPEKLKTMTCYECHQKGHLRSTCPSLPKNE